MKVFLAVAWADGPYYSCIAAMQDRNYKRNFSERINRNSKNNLVPFSAEITFDCLQRL